jgi:hypothetical protein
LSIEGSLPGAFLAISEVFKNCVLTLGVCFSILQGEESEIFLQMEAFKKS